MPTEDRVEAPREHRVIDDAVQILGARGVVNGSVVEEGTHGELMALGGQYAELYTLQASQYEL